MNTQNHHTLPEGWEIVKLDDVAKRGTGHTPDKEIVAYYNGGIKWVSLADSDKLDNVLIYGTKIEISEKGLKNSSAVLHPAGTVLLSRDAGVGKSAIMAEKMAVSQHFVTWTCGDKLDNFFLYYHLQVQKPLFERMAVGSTIKTIGLPFFKKLLIPLPPLPEQRQIAAVLGTWDRAIEQTTELLKALRTRHRGLMQQLLTGKKRLPGFEGEWRNVKLGEVFTERNQVGYTNLPLLSITAEQGVIYRDKLTKRDTSNEDKSKYKRICSGDIGYNTMRMWQGRSAVSSLEGIVSPAYTIVTPKPNSDVHFMGHLFKSPDMIHRFYRSSQGLVDDTLNCKFPEFAKVRVLVPPTLEEQRGIARVLDASLSEIRQNEAKLEALREQKRGLMQCLLTGQVRVPLPAQAA